MIVSAAACDWQVIVIMMANSAVMGALAIFISKIVIRAAARAVVRRFDANRTAKPPSASPGGGVLFAF
jgi:hypothetical protein